MKKVRWETMFPDELEKAFAECPVIWFSYGMCEPHGPHNAIGLDALKAHGIACKAAEAHGGIAAPPDFWHIHELAGEGLWAAQNIGEVPRNWMTSVPPWVHFKHICYHIRTADTLGAHAAILLTGHYGPNWEDLNLLVQLIQPYVGTRLYSLPDFEANVPGFDNDNKSGGDHAGKVETSLLMALRPECVDIGRIPNPEKKGLHWAMGNNAREADKRCGERMVADEVNYLGEKVKELLAEYDRVKPGHTFRTFIQVEDFWKKELEPRVKDFKCLVEDFFGSGKKIPADSVWFENSLLPEEYK